MSDNKNVDSALASGKSEAPDPDDIAASRSEVSSVAGSTRTAKSQPRVSSSSERQIKYERAQKCLENAALVSKRIKEHRKQTAELLGRPFEDDAGDTASELESTMSERTGYSAATDTSTTLSVQEALNIPGISESLANTLKQKELLMERIKQYKEISKRPVKTSVVKRDSVGDSAVSIRQSRDKTDATELLNTLKDKENALSVMQVKMKAMENTILDLQEKIGEKDQIIEAKNKATTLMSDNLSKKEKDSLVLLEDTRQQMIKMQENFINMEAEWKDEKDRLLKQLAEKDDKIRNLEEANTILENSRFEISLAHSKLAEELDSKNREIIELQEQLGKLFREGERDSQVLTNKEREDVEEEKGSIEIANMVELTKKIELLEQLNCQIRQTNKELENRLATVNPEPKPTPSGSPSKKASPLPTRKTGRNTAAKQKSPWSKISSESLPQETEKKSNKNELNKLEMVIQSLNKEILEKEYVISQKDSLIIELQSLVTQNESMIKELKESNKKDLVETGVCTDAFDLHTGGLHHASISVDNIEELSEDVDLDPKELALKLIAANKQIVALNEEIDAANKNMIKVKLSHKLKLKQMQKTIDNFSKVSDSSAEIVRLNEELHQLSQKVAELEEEKGNLQLHLVDYDSGRLTDTDVYKKMVEMENLAEARLNAISLLEAQKFDLVQELHELQQKNSEMEDKLFDMAQLHSEQVSSEIKSVQLEEQIDQLNASRKEFELIVDNLKLNKVQLEGTIKNMEEEREELMHKLENYIQENIELTDKLEKLSAEKVSSAESIEIVESLTTQEKLELEEYNKGLVDDKMTSHNMATPQKADNIEKLVEQSAELNRKIELFTQERQEVMEKMGKITAENDSLQEKVSELVSQCMKLQNNIDSLNHEKNELTALNEDLNKQIEELKRERLDIMKESVELIKPSSVEDTGEAPSEAHPDEKSGEKGNKGAKTVKQLTKDILKLKNTIKEREAEIGDCQMKILSLEEQQQKQGDLIQSIASYESKVKTLLEENQQLKDELENAGKGNHIEQQMALLQQANESLQQDLQKMHQEYASTINLRDSRIRELENLLSEYEKQLFNYGNVLQQKDKDIAEYTNQITKLNDVSQKLKSTIEILEEEKAKDSNAELIKSLNKQIATNQNKLAEYEDKLNMFEEEKTQLLSLRGTLESRNASLDLELKKLQEMLNEKQNLIKDLQIQAQKHAEEISNVSLQVKEKDEEIHEIKLQLRKESIENEKLRTMMSEKDNSTEDFTKELEVANEKLNKLAEDKKELIEQNAALELKNKELMDKLKKFAASIKKKSSLYNELEAQLNETQKQLEVKSGQLEQLLIQVDALPMLQDKLKHAEEELNRLHSLKVTLEQHKTQESQHYLTEIESLTNKLNSSENEILKLRDCLNVLQKDLNLVNEEKTNLKAQLDTLHNKLADHEVEQKNNTNFITKIASLEMDINQKQNYITELLSKLEYQEQQLNQWQFGHDAKVQEHNLYVESLEGEILKYKNRISRLEDSISAMEDRRNSLEHKADQLDSQLQEKQKAYSEYTSQEDQLVGRLAALMDHDRIVEKQLHEIDNENKELQYRIQNLNEENQHLKKALSDIQEHCNTLVEKASRVDDAEAEIVKYKSQIHDLDTNLKRLSQEHQTLLIQRKQYIEELESEFNVQIENAIKEKKVLSEKYEKTCEHVAQLKHELDQYRTVTDTLKINIEELTRVNQDLSERSYRQQTQAPDYTEQYITEINRLNALLNAKNQEVSELNNKLQAAQTNYMSGISNLERKIADYNAQLNHSSTEIERLVNESDTLKSHNEQLQALLAEKEAQLKHFTDKKMTFEMKVPKTEGLIISSTIEAYQGAPVSEFFDVSGIESQIVTDEVPLVTEKKHTIANVADKMQKKPVDEGDNAKLVSEQVIVPKKAYVCYKEGQTDVKNEQSVDPFNSDEGWGFGETEDVGEITPGLSHLNVQIETLKNENQSLKADLESNHSKLVKIMKKLKELKANNEMLSKEIQISKQISQSSFLDSAIEDELKIKIQDLEKKIEELNSDLNKERREKESIRKQNEVFNSANERLTDMKEKLDSEIELWKFKFKEANDKLSTVQWGVESKDSQEHKAAVAPATRNTVPQDDMLKLEKENDELQAVVDELTSQNKQLTFDQNQFKTEINFLKQKLQTMQTVSENIAALQDQLADLQKSNTELMAEKEATIKSLYDLEVRYNEIETLYKKSDEEFHINQKQLDETRKELALLASELESSNLKLLSLENQPASLSEHHIKPADDFAIMEKYSAMEDYLRQMEQQLANANTKIDELNSENRALSEKIAEYEQQIVELKTKVQNLNLENEQLRSTTSTTADLSQKTAEYEQQIVDLKTKIQNLNTENDQLLSSVAELRSSISSAVDQRGFEIAELWKQHLAQREMDFQKTEQELRTQLGSYESKYEQLLDSVQSSSQEETNALVMVEQLTSLQNKLQDKEEHLRHLQEKYAEVISQIDVLRSEMEDEKVECENKLMRQQEEYEQQIQDLTLKNQSHSEGFEQTYQTLQTELAATKAKNEELHAEMQDLVTKLGEYEVKIADLTNQIISKEAEIHRKTHDYTLTLNQRNEEFENVRKHLLGYEKKIEDLTYEKESELAVLRLKMHEKKDHYGKQQQEREAENHTLSEELKEKIIECTTLNKQIAELNKTLAEYANNSTQMQGALENQEMELVSLKEEISNLREMLRPSGAKTEKHVTFAADTKPPPDSDAAEAKLDTDLLDAVPRAELDLALYMLHQRDVRCEELTMELTRLLEERDTLQLRLSDSIRSCEELKSQCAGAGMDVSFNATQEPVSELPSFVVEKEHVETHRGQSSRSSSISDPDGDRPRLQAKLSELRTVRHSRDVLLRHDSEQRQLDLRLLQRDVANLPPEALDQLAQAHHTLSRDSQSTPTILLNWLRGKSTPKVVHM